MEQLNEIVRDIIMRRNQIIDDFIKAYVASQTFGKTEEEIKWFFSNIKLIETRSIDGLSYTWKLEYIPNKDE